MSKSLKNLTVDMTKLQRMPLQDRVMLGKSSSVSDIFGNLTPSQIADLFPKYYRDALPEVSKLMGATAGGRSYGGSGGSGGTSSRTHTPPTPPSVTQQLLAAADYKRYGSQGKFTPGGNFDQNAPVLMSRLIKDFGLTKEQAAGIVGNVGHESAGLVAGIQERGKAYGTGGLGWAQWTGPRRKAFENFLAANGMEVSDPDANYAFLKHELETTHSNAIAAVRNTNNVNDAMTAFEHKFEISADYDQRTGAILKPQNVQSRLNYANKALDILSPSASPATEPGNITNQNTGNGTDLNATGLVPGEGPTATVTPEQVAFDLSKLNLDIQREYNSASDEQKRKIEQAVQYIGYEEANKIKAPEIHKEASAVVANIPTTPIQDLPTPAAYDPDKGLPNHFNRVKGDPNSRENFENLTNVETPYGTVTVRKDAALAFNGLYSDLNAAGFPMQNGPGSFNIRRKNSAGAGHNPGKGWSQHSFGNATDIGNQTQWTPEQIEWIKNNPGKLESIKTKWGMRHPEGDDPHMEFMGVVSPEASAQVEALKEQNRVIESSTATVVPPADSSASASVAPQPPSTPPTSGQQPPPATAPASATPAPASDIGTTPLVPSPSAGQPTATPVEPPAKDPSRLATGGLVPNSINEDLSVMDNRTGEVLAQVSPNEKLTTTPNGLKVESAHQQVADQTMAENNVGNPTAPTPEKAAEKPAPIQGGMTSQAVDVQKIPDYLGEIASMGTVVYSPSQARAMNQATLGNAYGHQSRGTEIG